MRLAGFALLAAASAVAAQQKPAPAAAQPATQAAQPATQATQPAAQATQPMARPLDLNLKLDDLDRQPAVTFAPQEKKKQDAEQGLPKLGGKPSRTLNQPSTDFISPSNPNIE